MPKKRSISTHDRRRERESTGSTPSARASSSRQLAEPVDQEEAKEQQAMVPAQPMSPEVEQLYVGFKWYDQKIAEFEKKLQKAKALKDGAEPGYNKHTAAIRSMSLDPPSTPDAARQRYQEIKQLHHRYEKDIEKYQDANENILQYENELERLKGKRVEAFNEFKQWERDEPTRAQWKLIEKHPGLLYNNSLDMFYEGQTKIFFQMVPDNTTQQTHHRKQVLSPRPSLRPEIGIARPLHSLAKEGNTHRQLERFWDSQRLSPFEPARRQ
ncbi:hypothetical protein T439DRAFT_247165 [Meredithblackwellia eburnea MCA 4105]